MQRVDPTSLLEKHPLIRDLEAYEKLVLYGYARRKAALNRWGKRILSLANSLVFGLVRLVAEVNVVSIFQQYLLFLFLASGKSNHL